MLQKLIIRNYAIIDSLTIEPDKHLNTVTGETGAGKSIILGALSLILGERADISVLTNKSEKCFVEAHFDVKGNSSFLKALKREELDEDDQCIIRREIGVNGKSRAFVNDTPVTLSVLNKLTSRLVDLHQQFGHLALEDDHFQMEVIDSLAKTGAMVQEYQGLFKQFRSLSIEYQELLDQQVQWQKTSDYKQFLYDELHQASFRDNEIENAEQQLKQLNHSEKIISALQSSRVTLAEGEQPVINETRRVSLQLQSIADVLPDVQPLLERLNSVYAELKDIAAELETLEGSVSLDPQLQEELQSRLDLGYRLFKKHGVNSTSELLNIQSQLESELNETLSLAENIEVLLRQKDECYAQLSVVASKLSAQRCKVLPDVVAKVNKLLHLVGMPNAQFNITLTSLDRPDTQGMDKVHFLLDANKSGTFLPVFKAASGGEMSRIMLCIKSLTAKAMHLPTLIFDEVDTGISGEAARQVGKLLLQLGEFHQVICITHQPQVAAKGSTHFFVYKELDLSDRITTRVKILHHDERVLAIARMIGGEKPSEAALENARELVTL